MDHWKIAPPKPSSLGDHDVQIDGHHLKDKRVALVITGGIAAMKAPFIIRALRSQGASVVVFASEESLRYTTIDALEWSSNHRVVNRLTAASEHLSDNNPFDLYIVAPATYNTINKMANGIADNTVTTVLAVAIGRMERGKSKLVIAPTAHGMLHNSLLTTSLRKLENLGVHIIPPREEHGKHKLPHEDNIVAETSRVLSNSSLKNIAILVTGGPIPSSVDDVRQISNIFTGRLGLTIAKELHFRGAAVLLIQGSKAIQAPAWLPSINVNDIVEYADVITHSLTSKQYAAGIFTAAVADFRPNSAVTGKISSNNPLELSLVPTDKIINQVKTNFPDVYMITFKYEHNMTYDELLSKAHNRIEQGYPVVVANCGNEKGPGGEQIAHLVSSSTKKPQKGTGKLEIAKMITNHLEQIQEIAEQNG